MEKYNIIQDPDALHEFIEWLPELEKDEQFYGCLFARKKYDSTGIVTSDKGQLKRFTSTKERLFQKIKQLEVEVGAYEFNGEAVPQEALALYLMPNPRDFMKATRRSLIDFAVLVAGEQTKHRNPNKIVLNNIQKHGRKVFMDFDFDINKESLMISEFEKMINNQVNCDCYTIVETRGGYHVLVELNKIQDKYKKTWYQGIQKLGPDVTGDVLLPVPGCLQGNFVPKILERTCPYKNDEHEKWLGCAWDLYGYAIGGDSYHNEVAELLEIIENSLIHCDDSFKEKLKNDLESWFDK